MTTTWTPAKRAITALTLGKPDEIPTFELEFQLAPAFFGYELSEPRLEGAERDKYSRKHGAGKYGGNNGLCAELKRGTNVFCGESRVFYKKPRQKKERERKNELVGPYRLFYLAFCH